MGSDPAPFFANHFLCYHGSRGRTRTMLGKQEDLQICSGTLMILQCSMMVDSLTRVLKRYILQNFHSGRKIKQQRGSFLDLFVKIENNQFSIQVYDKTDDFPFSIVRMLYLKGNIPSDP